MSKPKPKKPCPVTGCEKQIDARAKTCKPHANAAREYVRPDTSVSKVGSFPDPIDGICPVPMCGRSLVTGRLCRRHSQIMNNHPEFTFEELTNYKTLAEQTKENVLRAQALLEDRTARGVKLCTCCEEEKPVTQFHACSAVKSNLRSQCKDCDRIQENDYYHNVLKHDPLYKVRHAVSNAVYYSLKAIGTSKKGQSCFEYLPYTADELRAHLESKFTGEMSWDNYGSPIIPGGFSWQLDHIAPSALFNYKSMEDPMFKLCWQLSNLQPLESGANARKNSMWEGRKINRGDVF